MAADKLAGVLWFARSALGADDTTPASSPSSSLRAARQQSNESPGQLATATPPCSQNGSDDILSGPRSGNLCQHGASSDETTCTFLVLEVRVNSYPNISDDYKLITLTVYSVTAPSNKVITHLDAKDDAVRVLVPHTPDTAREVRLQSNCHVARKGTERNLDSTWCVDPSWSLTPLVFETPVHQTGNRGTIDVTVDSTRMGRARFELQAGSTIWTIGEDVKHFSVVGDVELCTRKEPECEPHQKLMLKTPIGMVFNWAHASDLVYRLVAYLQKELEDTQTVCS